MNTFLVFTFLVLMIATTIAVLKLRGLFGTIMLFGIYSLLAAALFVFLDAVDVAFTEAAVGAGIAPILMLATLVLTGSDQEARHRHPWLSAAIVIATSAALLYGTVDMARYGDPQAPAHRHVSRHYIEESQGRTGLPNIVTSVLASYRGYDTLGEVVVIFTAGVGVLSLLGGPRRRRKRQRPAADED